jgi:hypothetical protein
MLLSVIATKVNRQKCLGCARKIDQIIFIISLKFIGNFNKNFRKLSIVTLEGRNVANFST